MFECPSSQESSYTPELGFGWLEMWESHRQSPAVVTANIHRGLRACECHLMSWLSPFFFLLFFVPMASSWLRLRRELRRRELRRRADSIEMVMEVSWRKSPPRLRWCGGRRPEAAMFMRWRPIDEAHKEGITIWSDVSISNTFSLGCRQQYWKVVCDRNLGFVIK